MRARRVCLDRNARFPRAYVTDTREMVFRASALSKRLPSALKSLRFCSDGLFLRHGRIPMAPSQLAICQRLILLSDALIVTARKVGRCAFGQSREFDRHLPIPVRSGQWVLHVPRQLALAFQRSQLA
jgi:hypothetical protein